MALQLRQLVLTPTNSINIYNNAPTSALNRTLINPKRIAVTGFSCRGLVGTPECLCVLFKTDSGMRESTDVMVPQAWTQGPVLQMPAVDNTGSGTIQYYSPLPLAITDSGIDVDNYLLSLYQTNGQLAQFTSATLYCIAMCGVEQ